MTTDTTPLAALDVVLFDVQATDTTPTRGQIIDVAWSRGSLERGFAPITASLVALEPGVKISRRVKELTGISATMLKDAPTLEEIRHEFEQMCGETLPVPVAHYARYERPFYEDLLWGEATLDEAEREAIQQLAPAFICTHDIARRLMPGLPRRGLRAIAGYFGAHLSELKRSEVHVEATHVIWQELVEALEVEAGVTTLEALRAWSTLPVKKAAKRLFPLPRERRLALPERPGVYRMLGRHGEVLYVGKATSLKQRVNSYFRGKKGEGERKLELATQIWELDITELDSPLEAALLEADEIKRHEPPYNKVLRSRERELVYLDHHTPWISSSDYDAARFRLGPSSAGSLFGAWRKIIEALRTGALEHGLGDMLHGLHDEAIFFEGLALWSEPLGGAQAVLQWDVAQWMAHGAEAIHRGNLWREAKRAAKRALKEAQQAEVEPLIDEDEDEDDDEEEREPWSWTPQAVAHGIEGIVRRAVRHLLRAELLALLAECDLSWTVRHGPRRDERLTLKMRDARPWHDGEPEREARGRGGWTLEDYDRLRVLTTELKRLCADPTHHPTLTHASSEVRLDAEQLLQRLWWV